MPLSNKALSRLKKHFRDKYAFEDQIPGGKADNVGILNFSREQLVKGIKIEFEHTDDFMLALEIATDHLMENPKYYDYLEDMEARFKNSSC